MKLSPKIEERLTPFMLVPEYYPDSRVVFLERDLSRQEWIGIGGIVQAVGVFAALIGASSDVFVIEWTCWIIAALLTLLFAAALLHAAKYSPLNRSLVVDLAREKVGMREVRRGRVCRELTCALADCRIERGFIAESVLENLDRAVLAFVLPDGSDEAVVVLAAMQSQSLNEYCALLPKALRERVVTTSSHRQIRAHPMPAYMANDYYALRSLRHCQNCGYDLMGVDAVRCPECGFGRWRENQRS